MSLRDIEAGAQPPRPQGRGLAVDERRTIVVPLAWREHALTEELVSSLCTVYEGMRSLLLLCCGRQLCERDPLWAALQPSLLLRWQMQPF